ncbi:MAG: S8/S53 family peptidase [Solirubrobacterales bacterium]|nr:S8/S53 family peptidase [Solirubrobacterales bacterium]
MHDFEVETGERRPIQPAEGAGDSPAFRSLLALFASGLAFFMICAGMPSLPGAAGATGTTDPQAPPMILPADAGASSGAAGADSAGWIVGGVPGRLTARIASQAGATAINRKLGSYRIARDEARQLADQLKGAGRLVYAEPDVDIERDGYPLDLFSDDQWWLNRIVSPSDVTPPTVTGKSPMIALIEESLDPLHPDLVGANLKGAKSLGPEADWHGTAIAGIIGSPGEMLGIRGVWPGARMRLFPSGLSCSTASKAVIKAVNNGAAVINMSYTFPTGSCFTHFKATQYAVRKGAVPVAAAGNTGATGNAPARPATDPHVLAVGAIARGEDDPSTSVLAPFSTTNDGVDISAPGAAVLAPYEETDSTAGTTGVKRTWKEVSGTSFSAPMVSAAAAWLKQVRPNLGNLQISRLLTNGATDLGAPGRDPEYGEGLLSIEKSLAEPTPLPDPYEPNDDIRWANGTMIGIKSPFLWRTGFGKRRTVTATLSRAKDPADVYRVLIPARRRIVVNVTQLEGDVVLTALKPKARKISKPGKNLIVRSNRPYPKTEGIVVRNLKKRPQSVWLALTPSRRQTGNDAAYTIKVARR